jgi:hypothetical protein
MRVLAAFCRVLIVAAAVGCDGAHPSAPSPLPQNDAEPAPPFGADMRRQASDAAFGGPRILNAADDGTTLKADAPVVQSPRDNVELETLRVTLVVGNARATFVEDAAFEYRFELHTGGDADCAPLAAGVVPQGAGTTQYAHPAELDQGRPYCWRARAEFADGGGRAFGPWSEWGRFRTPIVTRLDPPTLVHPINDALVRNPREFTVSNGAIDAASGHVIHEFEIDDDPAFASPIRILAPREGGPEAGGRSVGRLAENLVADGTYHWRVRACNDSQCGNWSAVGRFRTASTGDEIDASAVRYLHRNIADWDVTSTITDIRIGSNEICVYHTGAGTFPRTKFGSGGEPRIDVEGNPWVFAEFGGQWYGATWDWLRIGQQCKGESTDALGRDQIRIPPMDSTWRPRSGDTLCFAMSARARDNVVAGTVRSNIACTVVP